MPQLRSAFAVDDQRVIVGLLRAADVLVVVVAGFVTYWFRHGTIVLPDQYLVAVAVGALLTANYMQFAKLYAFGALQRFTAQFGTIALSWGAVVMTLLALAYFSKVSQNYSRIWGTSWFAVSFLALLLLRGGLSLLLDRWARQGRLTFNLVVIGAGDYGQRLIRYLARQGDSRVRVLGVFDQRNTRVPREIDGHKVLGTVDDLLDFVRENRVDQIIIALPWRAGRHLAEILKRLRALAIEVKLCPEAIAFDFPHLGYSDLAGVPMLKIFKPPLTGWSTVTKAIEDRVLGVAILLVGWPVLLLIAALIKLSGPGPVLFRQKRYGFNNNEITVLKFRTMHWDRCQGEAVAQARRNDPRVTWIGRFLRRTSLDELPQLFNVLRGDMSLVGPRPHAVAHNVAYAQLIDEYLGRHRVKPGITGWAQVNGLRGETQAAELMRQRVQHDLHYIENWSLLFDLKILFLTLFVGFINRNAY